MTKLRVYDLMTDDPVSVAPGADLQTVRDLMDQRGVRHLPVVEGESILGIISIRDLLLTEIDEKETAIRHLHDYLYHAPPRKSPE